MPNESKHALPHYLGLKLCVLPGFVVFIFILSSREKLCHRHGSALSILAIGHELVSGLDFEDVIHQFAQSKSKKKSHCKMCLPNEGISNSNMHFVII